MEHTTSFGTKAETLAELFQLGFSVPQSFYFTVQAWRENKKELLRQIPASLAAARALAVRSSSLGEDGAFASQAGKYKSILDVPPQPARLSKAIEEVSKVLQGQDQILIQPMVDNVHMSGVVMTKSLDDGSPYYCINYDDTSGRTDTITSGTGAHKTVYIYNGVSEDDFDSPRLRALMNTITELNKLYKYEPLDREFAIDGQNVVHILQVRRISAKRNWKRKTTGLVGKQIKNVEEYARKTMRPRWGLYGSSTAFGLMPDWNPAEMIGEIPRPLDFSLYRHLLTNHIWREARGQMGYRGLPAVELMVYIAGRPYIDVRASFNSFLPATLPGEICHKLVNAWIERLNRHPELHDKIEFEIVHTVADFDFADSFRQRYPQLLSAGQFRAYDAALRKITRQALKNSAGSTLAQALCLAQKLEQIQHEADWQEIPGDGFDQLLKAATLMEQCKSQGTLPFAVAARHGFIAEALLRSALTRQALAADRVALFKRNIHTISRQMSDDFKAMRGRALSGRQFIAKYGHLRAGTYDLLSLPYKEQIHFFHSELAEPVAEAAPAAPFKLTAAERRALQTLLDQAEFALSADEFLQYCQKAIAGREWVKFIFSRHVSLILELLAAWGQNMGLNRNQVAMMRIDDILKALYQPLSAQDRKYFIASIQRRQEQYTLAGLFKLSYLIRSPRDISIVPIHRSAPNFITDKRIVAPVARLSGGGMDNNAALPGSIVCIENADPGFDWIFTRNIAGLITRFGGANSHMAIRCAEFSLPAAIGCGSMIFDSVNESNYCLLDCAAKAIINVEQPR